MLGVESVFLHNYFAVMAFIFGAIVGSFLNVVIYRFHTGKSLSGHSHCLSCQHRLAWYELLPLISYIMLRGKCRTCGSYIPVRYTLVELMTASSFLAIFLRGGEPVTMSLLAICVALLIIIFVYDIYHYVIPNDLVMGVSIVALSIYGVEHFAHFNMIEFGYSLLAALLAAGFFWFLWRVSSGRWIGFGDVKLALPLGFLAGINGVFSMVILSFWVGAAISIVIISVQQVLKRGQIGLRFFSAPLKMKSEVPFAPFLIAGFILSYWCSVDVLELITYVLSY